MEDPRAEFIASNASSQRGITTRINSSRHHFVSRIIEPDLVPVIKIEAQPDDTAATVRELRIPTNGAVRTSRNSSLVVTTKAQLPDLECCATDTENEARSGPCSSLEKLKLQSSLATGTLPRLASSSASAGHTSIDNLRSRLQSLPKELYDEIEALTFTFDFTSEGRFIDRAKLQASHATSDPSSASRNIPPQYYGFNQDWEFASRSRNDSLLAEVQAWLGSLSPEALTAVHQPRLDQLSVDKVHSGLYSITFNKSKTRAVVWSGICLSRPVLKDHSNCPAWSPCYAWSPCATEHGRWTAKFVRVSLA